MKKLISIFLLVFSFGYLLVSVSVKADSFDMKAGASIRTTGNAGLRFGATISKFPDDSTHGFILVKGNYNRDTIMNAVNDGDTEISGNPIVIKEVEGTDTTFNVVIYNIGVNYYGQEITALAYTHTIDGYSFATDVNTRNIADVARDAYQNSNQYDNDDNLVYTIANACRVKIIHDDNTVTYASTIPATFAEGDLVQLIKGTYSESFTINEIDVAITGPNILKAGTANNRAEEANLTGTITISGGVCNTNILGLKFSGQAKIVGQSITATANPCRNLDGLYFDYNYVSSGLTSGNGFIYLATNKTGDFYSYNYDLSFSHNYFETVAGYAATKFIYLEDNENIYFESNTFHNVAKDCVYVQDKGKGAAGNVLVEDNIFEGLGGYGININWMGLNQNNGTKSVSISFNEFRSETGNSAYINIEDCNKNQNYSSFEISFNTFKGNIRILWFDGKILANAHFNYNKIYTNNSSSYICKSDYGDATYTIDCSKNIYIDSANDEVILGTNINTALFNAYVPVNYTDSYDTLEAYNAALDALK